MEKKQMYAAVAAVVVIIVVVAAAVWYMSGNDGGEDSEPGDTYYIYLDGMGDIDGWYTGTGNDARDATVNALEAEGITVDTSGWAIRRHLRMGNQDQRFHPGLVHGLRNLWILQHNS